MPSITKYSFALLGRTPSWYDTQLKGMSLSMTWIAFVEAGAGTAAVISPIGGVQHGDDFHVFYSETEVGPVTEAL